MRTVDELAADLKASNEPHLSCEEAYAAYVDIWKEMASRTFTTRGEALEAREKVLHQYNIEWDDSHYRTSLLNMLRPFLPDALLADVREMTEALASA